MKMAKASEADMNMAIELVGALDVLGQRFCPSMPETIEQLKPGDEREQFDRDDDAQCGRAMRYLLDLTDRASLSRVVWGMAVMLDPCNKCVDPNTDTIEHHPDVEAALGAKTVKPISEWHEDIGNVLWWTFPVNEPPWCGQPGDSDWPGYHTHWTPLLVPHAPAVVAETRITIIDATPPADFPDEVIIMDSEFGKRHPGKAFYLRVKTGERDVKTVDLDGEATLPGAVAAARAKGHEPTHWMEVGGVVSMLPSSIARPRA